MSPPNPCPRCGNELPPGGSPGRCLKCLGRLILSPAPPPAAPEAEAAGLIACGAPAAAPANALAPGVEGWHGGDYRLLKEIARGGMGIVYQAHQRSLDRQVAIKTILPGCLADEQAVRRFRTEAQAAAKLHHPNIVAVHEVGEHQGRHFYSMDFVDGRSLAQMVRWYPLSARQAAVYLKTIAEAIHYAHEQGVLHRDLKPSNILIDNQDQPRITDFGLAKIMREGSDQTLSGIVMGSPSYLAPEQAQGRASTVGVRSEVYALGAILYEMVCGRPPFQGESASATLRLVVESEPLAPRQINPRLSRDLETICLKCLEKEPARRYSDARALALDLGRYLAGEPITARRIGPAGKTWRWCRRNPALGTATACIALLLLLGFLGVTWQWRRAEVERRLQRLRAYAGDMRAAELAVNEGDLGQAVSLLERYLPRGGEKDLRGLEWRYLWQFSRGDDGGGFQYDTIPFSGDLSPDGQRIATASLDGYVRIHDWRGKVLLQEPAGYTKMSMPEPSVAFAPQGGWVAAATTANVLVWDTRQWRLRKALPCRGGVVAFSPDGRHLAAVGEQGLRVWSTRTWTSEVGPGECPVPRGPLQQLMFTPDSSRIVMGNRNSPGVLLWSLPQRTMLTTNLLVPQTVALAISPNGRWLAVGSVLGVVRVWDLPSLTLSAEVLPQTPWVLGLAFSPDSQVLATAGAKQLIHLWQAGTTNRLRVLRGHRGEVWWLRFAADGQWLVSGSADRTVRRWSLTAAPAGPRVRHLPDDCLLLDLTSRGTQARVFNPRTRALEDWDLARTNRLQCVALQDFPPEAPLLGLPRLDGHYLIAPGAQRGRTDVFDIRTGVRVFPPPAATNPAFPVCVSPDGRWLSGTERVNGQWEGGIWDLQTGRRRVTLADQVVDNSQMGNAAFSPDSKRLAYETVRHTINVYHLPNARTLCLPGHGRALYTLKFSPDGRWLASGSWDSTVRVWDTASGRPITPWLVNTGVDALAFSRDGQTLITRDNIEGSFRAWHILTGTEVVGKHVRSPLMTRAVDSEETVFMTGIPGDMTALLLANIPALADVDAQIRTNGLLRLEPAE